MSELVRFTSSRLNLDASLLEDLVRSIDVDHGVHMALSDHIQHQSSRAGMRVREQFLCVLLNLAHFLAIDVRCLDRVIGESLLGSDRVDPKPLRRRCEESLG